MSLTFSILAAMAMLAVLGVLGIGLFGMVKGGAFNRQHGNRLMRWRVGLQALALVLVLLAMASGAKN